MTSEITRATRPWTRWWWLGNAVDKENLTRQLESFAAAGLGGVEITPIYGVKGEEAREIEFLSDKWREMLHHTLAEAERLNLGVDISTGTGWPFGGPNVTDADSQDKLVLTRTPLKANQPFFATPQASLAVSPTGKKIRLDSEETKHLKPLSDGWILYAASQKWAGRNVKRAAPGGEGRCINPFSRASLTSYLRRFDDALESISPGAIRCQFHDSFEYLADWSPDFLDEFLARRGYDLRFFLDTLAGDGDSDIRARVKTDYRETLGELLRENFTQTWTHWAHEKGSFSRNQAHGSPGNLLDLYGAADIPETETFGGFGDPRASKFASSAAHVLGKSLTSSETCTWLAEHFCVRLADCKRAIDGLLASGINHIFYHGTPYSPADAAWPGWLFYASTTFAPTDPLWHDFPTLNAYVTRCQAILQSGKPDNDVLLFWPLHDFWQKNPDAFLLEINGKWLTDSPIGATAQTLWRRGFAFDYVSDAQLALAEVIDGDLRLPGGVYKTVVVPPCEFLPLATLRTLARLSDAGASVIFQADLPRDVPGLADLDAQRQEFQKILTDWKGAKTGGNLEENLTAAGARRGKITDHDGVIFDRRKTETGHAYFLVNQSERALDGWINLAAAFQSARILDPMTGKTGAARRNEMSEIYLQLPPGASVIVETSHEESADEKNWPYEFPIGKAVTLTGKWRVEFVDGGPELPGAFETQTPVAWTERGDENADRFAGTARYSLTFDAPNPNVKFWRLDLGEVCESARLRVNGVEIGMRIAAPFCVTLENLPPRENLLEIDVTNLAANRIRDLDRRGVEWKIFKEINFVGIDYRPFDASNWPIRPSGLRGPVTLTPLQSPK